MDADEEALLSEFLQRDGIDGMEILARLETPAQRKAAARFVAEGEVRDGVSDENALDLLAQMDDDVAAAMFKVDVDDVPMMQWRSNIADLVTESDGLTATDAADFVGNMYRAQRLDGDGVEIDNLENLMNRMTTANSEGEFIGYRNEADRLVAYAEDPDTVRIEVEPIDEVDFAVEKADGATEFIEAKGANGAFHKGKLKGYITDAQRKFTTARKTDAIEIEASDDRILQIGTKRDGIKTSEFGSTRSSIKDAIEATIKDMKEDGDFPSELLFDEIRIVTNERVYEFSVDALDA